MSKSPQFQEYWINTIILQYFDQEITEASASVGLLLATALLRKGRSFKIGKKFSLGILFLSPF